MTDTDGFNPKAIGLFLLFGSSIILGVGLNFYLLNENYLMFLVPFAVWLAGTLYSIKFLNRSSIIEIKKMDRK